MPGSPRCRPQAFLWGGGRARRCRGPRGPARLTRGSAEHTDVTVPWGMGSAGPGRAVEKRGRHPGLEPSSARHPLCGPGQVPSPLWASACPCVPQTDGELISWGAATVCLPCVVRPLDRALTPGCLTSRPGTPVVVAAGGAPGLQWAGAGDEARPPALAGTFPRRTTPPPRLWCRCPRTAPGPPCRRDTEATRRKKVASQWGRSAWRRGLAVPGEAGTW